MEKKTVWWQWLILAAVLAFSLVSVWPPKEKIRLGLDLQGGSSFTVQIDQQRLRNDVMRDEPEWKPEQVEARVQEILRDADSRALEVLRNRIDALGINEPVITAGRDHRILIQLPGVSEEDRQQAEDSVQSAAFLEFRLVHRDNQRLVEALLDSGRAPEGYEVISVGNRRYYRRTDAFETVRREPEYALRLSMFEIPDPSYAFMLERRFLENVELYRPAFVRRRAEMTGENLHRAQISTGMYGGNEVSLEFNAEGARDFARITDNFRPGGPRNRDNNRGRQLAVVLDGTLYSAPEIEERIPGGRAVIRGAFTAREVAILAHALNAGSLPAPVRIIEKRFVSPTLGRDAVQSGIRAMVYGGLLVLVFMLVYYRYCGLIANLTLILDMLLLPAGMILAGGMLGVFVRRTGFDAGSPIQLPVLTLPGIAGILLTIGMAVDANVLIFERIREEMKSGKRLRSAILAGYDRATLTIVDANVTTLLTALILFLFGSGPIRGFAITLSAGILVSMFTVLFAMKIFFLATVPESRTGVYRMMSLVRDNLAIDFLAKRKTALMASGLLIVLAWAVLGARVVRDPVSVLAIDFTGGTSLSYHVAQRAPADEIRQAVDTVLRDPQVQYQRDIDSGRDTLILQSSDDEEAGDDLALRVEETLRERFPALNVAFQAQESIGAQIGREMTRDAVWAVIFALVGMILYITLRFEFGFSIGAIAALVHDVLLTAGLYSLSGRSFSLPIVAALLTIVGYSINDTIVVFDRIREDIRLDQRKSFAAICNLSINQTLSRTLLTSTTTFLAMLSLFIFGGGAINDFAFAMLIGILVGTYSSVFVATPVTLAYYGGRRPGFAASKKI